MTVCYSGVASMKNCILMLWGQLCAFGLFLSAGDFLVQQRKLVLSSELSNFSLSFLPGEVFGHLILSKKSTH